MKTILIILFSITLTVQAATPPDLPILDTQDPFSIPSSNLRNGDKKMPVFINEVGTIKLTHQFDNPTNIYALAITGQIALHNDASSVKVILVDNKREYLVYEAYPFLTDDMVIPVTEVCEETCLLSEIVSFSLRFELQDASIQISELTYADSPKDGDSVAIKAMQNKAKIQKINEQNLGWLAGETSISILTYEEKKRLFLEPIVPNLRGFEYYRGGIFEIKSNSKNIYNASSFVSNFDWRNRHGVNWMTPVKNQSSCGSCWAFAAAGTIESVTNLYFNQHLDLDLSEQHALSCSSKGSCTGGSTGAVLDYYSQNTIIDESCFPYSATDESCVNKCGYPNDKIKISGRFTTNPRTENLFKKMLIENGPASTSIHSLSHAMTLVGFEKDSTDNMIVWIFKNSWGDNWGAKTGRLGHKERWGEYWEDGYGKNGYAYIKLNVDNMTPRAIQTPIISSNSYSINCEDNDGDQYCNWGISKIKPSTCPSFCNTQPDCDDSNPNARTFDENYNCGEDLPPPPVEQQFTIYNDGNGILSVNSIAPETSASWISVTTPTPFDILPKNSKPVSVQVDFSQAPTGQRTTRLLVNSNDPDENPYPDGVNIVVERSASEIIDDLPTEETIPIAVQPTEIQFKNLNKFYSNGNNIVRIELAETGSRNQTTDLWVAVNLPNGEWYFATEDAVFRQEIRLFKPSLSINETTHFIPEFIAPPGINGDYIFYALYVTEGKNPISEIDNLEAISQSNLEMQIINLVD
ncbi:MAG: C1 family peptidase [Candidatus Marithrix sp.]